MLRRIENRYEEQLKAVLKDLVSTHRSLTRGQIESDVARILKRHGKIPAGATSYVHLDILPGLFIAADVKLLPNGEPETTKDSEVVAKCSLVFERFRVGGHWRFFLAFCLQEGELVYGPTFMNKCRECVDHSECYFHMISALCFKNSHAPDLPNISAWIQYVERKYDIYAPPVHGYEKITLDDESDETPMYLSLLDFLANSHLGITGGIMFDKCL